MSISRSFILASSKFRGSFFTPPEGIWVVTLHCGHLMDPKRTYGKVIKILCIIKIKNNLTDQDSPYQFLILHLNTSIYNLYLYFYQCITLFIFLYIKRLHREVKCTIRNYTYSRLHRSDFTWVHVRQQVVVIWNHQVLIILLVMRF